MVTTMKMICIPSVGDIVGDGSSDDDDEPDQTVVEDGSVYDKIETAQYHIISIRVMGQDSME